MLRIGLVGFGTGGRCFHAPFIEAADNICLAGVVARSVEKVRQINNEYPHVPVFSSLTEMIRSDIVDAVAISTPPSTRFELAMEAINAGLHVVADKPMALNAAQGQQLVAAANARGIQLSAYHNRRYDADIQTLKWVMDNGELGAVWRFHSRMDLDEPSTLYSYAEGGLLQDLGSHLVDQALWLMGPAVSVFAHLDEVELPAGRTDAGFALLIEHAGGTCSYLEASKANHMQGREIRVYAANGSYECVKGDQQELAIKEGKRPSTERWHWGQMEGVDRPVLHMATGTKSVDWIPGRYQDYYTQFVAAVLQGADLPVSGAEALAVLKVLDAARESASSHTVVTL